MSEHVLSSLETTGRLGEVEVTFNEVMRGLRDKDPALLETMGGPGYRLGYAVCETDDGIVERGTMERSISPTTGTRITLERSSDAGMTVLYDNRCPAGNDDEHEPVIKTATYYQLQAGGSMSYMQVWGRLNRDLQVIDLHPPEVRVMTMDESQLETVMSLLTTRPGEYAVTLGPDLKPVAGLVGRILSKLSPRAGL
jgi:hypothetical protein